MSLDPPLTEAQILAEVQRRVARAVGANASPPAAVADPCPMHPQHAYHACPESHSVTVAVPRSAVIRPVLGPDSPLRQISRTRAADREFPIQAELVAWADDPTTLPQYPELKTLYAVPNQSGAGGKRTKRQRQLEGARRKAEGRRKGMTDLVLPTPRRDHDGRVFGALYLELKDEQGTLSKAQRERIAALRAAGNRCEVAMSADAAQAIITMYLQLPKP